jgi:DNA-binding MarR family transcriptional regulator
MASEVRKLSRIVSAIRTNIGPTLPLQQLALLMLVAEAGDDGITMPEAVTKLGMGQTSVSKNAMMLSKYAEHHGGAMTIKGYDLIATAPDLSERRRLCMTLTPKGKDVIEKIVKEVTCC